MDTKYQRYLKSILSPYPPSPSSQHVHFSLTKGWAGVRRGLSHPYLEPKFVMLRPLPASNALKCGILPHIHLDILEPQKVRCFP